MPGHIFSGVVFVDVIESSDDLRTSIFNRSTRLLVEGLEGVRQIFCLPDDAPINLQTLASESGLGWACVGSSKITRRGSWLPTFVPRSLAHIVRTLTYQPSNSALISTQL